MKIWEEKTYKKIKRHKWFAWYPCYAWTDKGYEKLSIVWLEDVWRESGHAIKWRRLRINNKTT